MKAKTKDRHPAGGRKRKMNEHLVIGTKRRAIKLRETKMKPETILPGEELKERGNSVRKSTIKRKEHLLMCFTVIISVMAS